MEERLRARFTDLAATAPDPASRGVDLDSLAAAQRDRLTHRRQFLVGAAASAAMVGTGLGWRLIRSQDGTDQQVSAGPPKRTGPAFTPGWHHIEATPASVAGANYAVWAGDRLIVFGGGDASRDGVSWSPTERRWKAIASAPAPASPDGCGFAVWNGTEMFVGIEGDVPPSEDGSDDTGYQVMAYSPTDDAWRDVIPTFPDTRRRMGTSRQAVVAAGQLLIAVVPFPAQADHTSDIVAVDIATGRRRLVDPGPFGASPLTDDSSAVRLTAVGDVVVASTSWDLRPWVLDIRSWRWRQAAAPSDLTPSSSNFLQPMTAIGDRALMSEAAGPRLWSFNPSIDGETGFAWTSVPPNPLSPAPDSSSWNPVWSGTEMFVPGAALDPVAGTWRAIEALPGDEVRSFSTSSWIGDALVLFGGSVLPCRRGEDCAIPAVGQRTPPATDGWLLAIG
jgi:hypothetical protein